jgi:hypothetical protein
VVKGNEREMLNINKEQSITDVKAIDGVSVSPRITVKWKKETSVTKTGDALL